MTGAPCPSCGRDVMTFRAFLLKVEPYKTYPCQHCSALLGRGPAVWLLLLLLGAIGGVAGVVIRVMKLPPLQVIAVFAALLVVMTIAAKLVAYRFVGWRLVERERA